MSVATKYPYQMSESELAAEVARRMAKLDELRAWRDAAVADGWSIKPTYGEGEPVEWASKLTREGFVVSVLTRPANRPGFNMPEASINAWGPDRRALDHVLTPTYDMGALRAGLRTCPECGAKDVDTVGVAFANRACAKCAPLLKAKYEVGNWTE